VLAERLCACLAAEPALAAYGITASLGIASFPFHGPTPEEILRMADCGMYLAKHQNGNRVRVASFTTLPACGDADQQILDAEMRAMVRRLSSTGPEIFKHYLRRLERMKQAGCRESSLLIDTLISLAFFVDAKDPLTQGHCHGVELLAKQIARQAGLAEAEVDDVGLAGVLHDVGKIGIPENVLNKPARLTPEEYEIVKAHVALGAEILESLKVRTMDRIRGMVYHHHEFFNGRGYPDGLRAQEIPLGARILSVADSFDTMVSERVYKQVRSMSEAIDELRRCCGTQFDPAVVDSFVRSLEALGDPRQRAPLEEPVI
jgi:putative nucleotidyltransferase with HDIG domain